MTDPIYETTNTHLCAFLRTVGVNYLGHRKEINPRTDRPTYIFQFAESTTAAASPSSLAKTFLSGDPTVPLRSFLSHLRDAQDTIHGKNDGALAGVRQ